MKKIIARAETEKMAEEEQKIYHLYVLQPEAIADREIANERFFRATPRYALLYTQSEISVKHAEITKSEMHRLSPGDMSWLRDCFLALMSEAARKNENVIAKRMNERLDRLEAALKEEKEKQERGV